MAMTVPAVKLSGGRAKDARLAGAATSAASRSVRRIVAVRRLVAAWTLSVLALYLAVAALWLHALYQNLVDRPLPRKHWVERPATLTTLALNTSNVRNNHLQQGLRLDVDATTTTSQRGAEADDTTAAVGEEEESRWVERLARPFAYLRALPCLPSEPRWFGPKAQRSPTNVGLLFVKPYKAASSTAAGVHLRISSHLAARRRNRNNNNGNKNNNTNPEMCLSRFDHAVASNMGYGSRRRLGVEDDDDNDDDNSSFLWSIVRDPTARAVSQFYHFVVGRHGVEATDENFRAALGARGAGGPTDYYLRILSLNERDHDGLASGRVSHDQAARVVAGIVSGYDFLAVTERFDESLVALQLLSRGKISLASLLYLPAKRGGGYDDGGGKRKCVYIPNHALTPAMQDYLDSPAWRSAVRWDNLLYRVANRSLDRTIDETIGRSAFERQLDRYRTAQRVAQDRCLSRAVFPCDEQGRYHNVTNCIWNDSGCGSDCLDELATELDLW